LWIVLRDGIGRWRPIVGAVILLLGYPLHLAFSVGQLAVPIACLMFHAVRWRDRSIAAGLVTGVALVKFTLTWPLLLLLALRGSWRGVAIAALVQAVLFAIACIGWRAGNDPFDWLTRMRANITASQQPGGLTDPTAPAHSANHLEITALL